MYRPNLASKWNHQRSIRTATLSPPEAAAEYPNLLFRMIPLVLDKLPELEALCRRHGVRRLELIGSAATGAFDPASSDLDFLVDFGSQPRSGWDDVFFRLLEDLQRLFARPVDLIESHVPKNPYFLASINRQRRVLYAA